MLRKLEETLRVALEAPFAQLFPDKLHPLELAAALRQEMDRSRLLTPGGIYAANRYTVTIGQRDYQELETALPAVERELAEHLAGYSASEGLATGPDIRVLVSAEPGLTRGRMALSSGFAERPAASLTIEGGIAGCGERYQLAERVILGRSADCDLSLDEAAVSRRHAEIFWQYVHYQIRDLDSANGTFVNGQPVNEIPLANGDLVELGLVQLRFRTE